MSFPIVLDEGHEYIYSKGMEKRGRGKCGSVSRISFDVFLGVLRRLADRSSGSNEASALILSTVASLNFSKPPGSNRKTAPASASVAKAVLKASGSRVPQGRAPTVGQSVFFAPSGNWK